MVFQIHGMDEMNKSLNRLSLNFTLIYIITGERNVNKIPFPKLPNLYSALTFTNYMIVSCDCIISCTH